MPRQANRRTRAGWGILVSAILALPVTAEPRAQSEKRDPRTAGMLEFIGTLEAPGGYDVYSRYAAAPPPRPLTTMTVTEVLAWQDSIDARSRSEAAGRFQIMEDTLRDYIVPAMGLKGDEIFDKTLQDAMAVTLMARRGWTPETRDLIRVGNALALEWAALPLLSGPDAGKSAHHDTPGVTNRALASPAQFLAVLKDPRLATAILNTLRQAPPPRIASSPRGTQQSFGAKSLRTPTRTRVLSPKEIAGGPLSPSRVIVFETDPYAQQ